ncbi:MAG: ADP-forming succinate--CoA ligase subunit beta [Candidatus Omnitrophota bacterium]
MKLHEYQAKKILAEYGVSVPRGAVASTPLEAEVLYERLAFRRYVLKAQIHAGGRGKAGGIQTADSRRTFNAAAQQLLGRNLVTAQTGPQGVCVRRILVEEAVSIAKEYYLGIVIDRRLSLPAMIASPAGGVEIETLVRKDPEAVHQEPFDPVQGLSASQSSALMRHLKLPVSSEKSFQELLSHAGRLFLQKDLSLLEINPLVLTPENHVVALDCKMVADDNALYRHPELAAMWDREAEDLRELLAREAGVSYVTLEGDIGCLVNGAGLAMATMDVIELYGGRVANFLDVGGGANVAQVREAFKILVSDERIRAVLVNIFGGIMKCDVIAEGVLSAVKEVSFQAPLVVRLEGTHAALGKKIFAASGLRILSTDTMDDAAQKAVDAATKHE